MDLVTPAAERYQIRKTVCSDMTAIALERLYMVYVESAIQLIFRDTALLACVVVTLPRSQRLLSPVASVVYGMAAAVCWAVFTALL